MAESAHVAGIVLAAGFSRRLGQPKQTVVLQGETLLERAARVAREAGLDPVVVVVNSALAGTAKLVVENLEALGCVVVVNLQAAEGMASSIRVGMGALAGADVAGTVLMTCDQIAVGAEHLRELCAELEGVAGSGYGGKVGVPAYFPVNRFAELHALQGDQGARELLHGARAVATEALALDVDTDEELRRAEAWVNSGSQ